MSVKCFVFGLLVGVGVTAAAFTLAGYDTPLCEVVVNHDAQLKELNAAMSYSTLRCRGRDVGVIEADTNGIESMTLCGEHQVYLKTRNRIFPGYYSVSLHDVSSPYDPFVTIIDDDLDGIPDRRMDWETNTRFILENITWKPVQKTVGED